MKIKNIIFSIVIMATAVGCSGFTQVMLKPGAMKNIRSIAIIEMKEPTYLMMDLSSATPWGAISEKSRADEIKPKFVAVLKKERFSFKQQLSQQLNRALTKAGYKVYSIKMKRAEIPATYLESYDKYKNGKYDAILDIVTLGAGYTVQQPIFSNFWRPQADALVRLVDAKSGAILYDDRLMYGHHNPFMSGVDIDAPKKFHFDEREDIFKAGNKVIIAGLKDAANKIALHVGKEFKK